MSQPPDSDGKPSPWSAAPVDAVPPSGGTRTLLIVLLAIAMFVLIIAACGLVHVGMQQATQTDLQLALPDRGEPSDRHASVLAASVQPSAVSAHPEIAEVRRWLAAQIGLAQQTQPIAPQADLFFAAAMGSPERGGLNLFQQFQLRASLHAGLPGPGISASDTILDIVAESAPDTARVATLFYAPGRLANSQIWHLVKTDNQWELYDWFDAEFQLPMRPNTSLQSPPPSVQKRG